MAPPQPRSDDLVLPRTSNDFRTITWCKALLEAPNTTVFLPASRDPSLMRKHKHHDKLFAKTLAGPDAIPACVCFYATPSPGDRSPITEMNLLFSLASGVDGYPGVMHGGAVGVLMDEILGILVQQNMDLESDHAVFRANPATATMDLRFKRPIPTPCIVRGRGRIAKLDGKKLHLAAEILDASGLLLASCFSVRVRENPTTTRDEDDEENPAWADVPLYTDFWLRPETGGFWAPEADTNMTLPRIFQKDAITKGLPEADWDTLCQQKGEEWWEIIFQDDEGWKNT